ncbi:MAG: hypothetical protein HY821_22955 [Acidobacteria bacterium]|nr:hypothetical protein [Acidobacteriota bacterium]
MLTLAILMMMQAPAQPAPPPAAPPQAAVPASNSAKSPVAAATAPASPASAATKAASPAPAPVPAPAPASELLQVKNVYVLQMGSAFDQYLANWIQRKGPLQVVTDPERADAILTDRLGKGFDMALKQLYPEPEPVAAPKPEDGGPENQATDVKVAKQDRFSSFGRGKGTIFLVNRSTRNVVWSIYLRPKSVQADDLNDAAKEVAGELASAVNKQMKAYHEAQQAALQPSK